MQRRQLRLGDILDDYCPRERRLTNHAVVAMVGDDVKQTRCTTCDTEHEYKHAKIPRQRRKSEAPAALYAQVLAGGPKRVTHESPTENSDVLEPVDELIPQEDEIPEGDAPGVEAAGTSDVGQDVGDAQDNEIEEEPSDDEAPEEGPVHRPLIRATLPRQEGQAPPARPAPEFTIRQPGGRQNRFRPRQQRGAQQFQGNRFGGNSGGGGNVTGGRGGAPRQNGGRPPQGSMNPRVGRRHGSGGPGRKRSK